ncbi:hypothetical protein Y788_11420 [Pantoea dispersa 625]|nr:hypothetical protein Y788_11420 [Pantoea dispersa 625]
MLRRLIRGNINELNPCTTCDFIQHFTTQAGMLAALYRFLWPEVIDGIVNAGM